MVIDSHCHLHDPVFCDALDALRVAQSLDVWGVIAVGCDVATNARNLQLAASAPKGVWACLGFHPDQDRLTDVDLEAVERQLTEHHSRVVGLGEVGLPWYSLEGKADAAERMARGRARLDRLLALAARYDLAVSLHAPHGAAADALQALQRHRIERAVFHWHKASPEVTRDIVEAGYFISVTPEVVYRERDRALVEGVPLQSLLVGGALPGAGLALARFDFRGWGESSGAEEQTTVATRIEDVEAVLARLEDHPRLDGRLGLLGSSLGGFVALFVASRRPDTPVVTWNAPASLTELANDDLDDNRGPGVPFAMEYMEGRYALAPKGVGRHLIVHGEDDDVVSLDHGMQLHDQADEPCDILVIPGGDHRLTDPAHRAQAVTASVAWLKKFFL